MRAKSAALAVGISLMVGGGALAHAADSQDAEGLKPAPHAYRLTYTLTELDGAKRVGVQRYSMSITGDHAYQEITLGSRVPIATGADAKSSPLETQFQYFDVGLDIQARIQEFSNGLELDSRIKQSGVADLSSTLVHQPVIRHSELRNTTVLTPGKPVRLGSLDEPGGTHHLDIEVSIEPLP